MNKFERKNLEFRRNCYKTEEEKSAKEKQFEEFQCLVLDELEAIRKMVLFFVVLTVISLVCGLILIIS